MGNRSRSRFLVWLLLSVGALAVIGIIGLRPSQAQARRPPNIVLLSPKAGDILTPGERVAITWEIDAPPDANYQGCEQEIYLSTDKGRTIAARLTPEFGYWITSYTWTVPNLPAKKAVIIMGFDCEGGTPIFESQYSQRQSIFKITRPPARFEEVRLSAASESVSEAGREIRLSWDSTASNVEKFEIQLSMDEGAHFQTVGLASDHVFTVRLPANSGEATFRVIAHKGDGTTLESQMASQSKLERAQPAR